MKRFLQIVLAVMIFHFTGHAQWKIQSYFGGYMLMPTVIDGNTILFFPMIYDPSISVRRSTDKGINWTNYNLNPSQKAMVLAEIEFASPAVGFAVGATYPEDINTVMKTIDSGKSWFHTNLQIDSSNNTPFEKLTVINEHEFFVSKFDNSLYRTKDGGVTFLSINYPGLWTTGILGIIKEIKFINESTGFVALCGFDDQTRQYVSKVIKTIDTGMTWTEVYATDHAGQVVDWRDVSKIQFIDEHNGFAVNILNQLFITKDGGQSWHMKNLPDSTGPVSDFHFVTESSGYVIRNSKIHKTIDAGDSWSVQRFDWQPTCLNYLFFPDKDFGYAFSCIAFSDLIATPFYITRQKHDSVTAINTVQQKPDFILSPNPSSSWIRIQYNGSEPIQSMSIYNVLGSLVKEINRTEKLISVNDLKTGIYYLNAQIGDAHFVYPLMKQ